MEGLDRCGKCGRLIWFSTGRHIDDATDKLCGQNAGDSKPKKIKSNLNRPDSHQTG